MLNNSNRRVRFVVSSALTCVVAAWLISAGLRSASIGWVPMFWAWATLASALLVICLGVTMASRHVRHSYDKADTTRLLGSLMLVCFCAGAYLFGTAFRQINATAATPMTCDEAFVRSMICSFKLFVLDLSGFVYSKIGSSELKSLITLQAGASFACTMLLVWSLVATRLRAWLRLRMAARRLNPRQHLFIFFGINDRTTDLARDIRRSMWRQAEIIFVERSRIDSSEGKGMARITEMLTHKREYFELAESMGAHITFASKDFEDITPGSDSVLIEMDLPVVSRMVSRTLKWWYNRVHLFLLDDDTDTNISRMMTLSADPLFSGCDSGGTRQVNIYVGCNNSPSGQSLTYLGLTRRINVKVVDESKLAVDMLRLNGETHPVRVAALQPGSAAVSQPFNALVIGMGRTGREAVKFLYEFGAFADADGCRTPFSLTAVDPHMDIMGPRLLNAAPALRQARNADGSPLLTLVQTDAGSEMFMVEMLPKIAATLNYAVIAIPDGYASIELAALLLDAARRADADLSRLRIEVRYYNSDHYSYMHSVADLYNSGAGADVIHVFGSPDSLYTCSNVVRENVETQGQRFYEGYSKCSGKYPGSPGYESWYERRNRLSMRRERPADALRELVRKESQDISNAMHIATKQALLDHIFGQAWRSLRWPLPGYHQLLQAVRDGKGDRQADALMQLAKLEHVRWMAALEIAGYTRGPLTQHIVDDCRRIHNCLVDWQALDTEIRATGCDYKLYDLMVVYTTIELEHEKHQPNSAV